MAGQKNIMSGYNDVPAGGRRGRVKYV
jgi:hypothetical protein